MSAIKLTSADFKNKVADITKEWKFLGVVLAMSAHDAHGTQLCRLVWRQD